MKRYLVLEDGTIYEGTAFGSENKSFGEVVFNTGMIGYQDILSDLSYAGQIIAMTYPLIGNYGISGENFYGVQPAVAGMIVRECCKQPSNYKCDMGLSEFLKLKGIPGIEGIDTRALTRKLRDFGTLKGMLCNEGEDLQAALKELKQRNLPANLVEGVSTTKSFQIPGKGKKVVVIDFGAKQEIISELTIRGCNSIVVPFCVSAEEIAGLKPDGILLSDGPGDPNDIPQTIEAIKALMKEIPMFGIGLGHQLLATAAGAKIEKMKFGHRGANYPVKNIKTGKIEITVQNHGYAVDVKSLEATDLEVTHTALNGDTIEGIKHKKYPAFSVQYYPPTSFPIQGELSMYDEFMFLMNQGK